MFKLFRIKSLARKAVSSVLEEGKTVSLGLCLFVSELSKQFYFYSGLAHLFRKFTVVHDDKKFPSGPVWVIGLYFAMFGFADQQYQNQYNILQGQVSAIRAGALTNPKYWVSQIPALQNKLTRIKPEIWNPYKTWNSFFGLGRVNPEISNRLKEIIEFTIEADGDLRNVFLADANLEGANLVRANLVRADLEGANLVEANLYQVRLMDANLYGANLIRAMLPEADLSYALLQDANLERAILQDATLAWVILKDANLERAYLWRADLSDAKLREANLQGANLKEAFLTNTDLKYANLKKADLQWAKLQGANLQGTDLSMVNLEEANLEGANLEGANLEGANFYLAILQGADLRKVKGLLCEQILESKLDRRTKIPKYLTITWKSDTEFECVKTPASSE